MISFTPVSLVLPAAEMHLKTECIFYPMIIISIFFIPTVISLRYEILTAAKLNYSTFKVEPNDTVISCMVRCLNRRSAFGMIFNTTEQTCYCPNVCESPPNTTQLPDSNLISAGLVSTAKLLSL